MLDGFYCIDCKREIDKPRVYRIPKVRNPKDFVTICICPICKGQKVTEIIDGEVLENEVNEE